MYEKILSIIIFCVGILSIIFCNELNTQALRFRNSVWGLKFGEKEIARGKIIYIISGSIFAIFGFLLFFGFIHFKK